MFALRDGGKVYIFLFVALILGIEGRSLNIVVNHAQNYGVKDKDILAFIRLDERQERQLELSPPFIKELQQGGQQHPDNDSDYADELKNDYAAEQKSDTENMPDISYVSSGTSPISFSANGASSINPQNGVFLDDDIGETYDSDNNGNEESEDYVEGTNDGNGIAETSSGGSAPDPMMKDQYIPKHLRLDDVIDDDKELTDPSPNGTYRHGLSWSLARAKRHSNVLRRRLRRAAQEQMGAGMGGANLQKEVGTSSVAGEGVKQTEPIIWEEVSDEDIRLGKQRKYIKIAKYAGVTLLSVLLFVFIGICFIRDPVMCIFAFGTGCPCCLVCCPCIRSFTDKYLDTKRLVRDSMNKYMPGVIVKEDGKMEFYNPTAEEVAILHEILEEIQG